MTFIYELDAHSFGDTPDVPNMNLVYIKAFESYRLTDIHTQTDRQTDRYLRNYKPRRFAGGQ